MKPYFEFRKIYADTVAPDGTVCVAYLSWVYLAGWHSYGSVETYDPDGTWHIEHALEPPALVAPETPIEAIDLSLRLPSGRFTLEYEPIHGPWTPTEPAPCGDMDWSVKLARGRGRARFGDGRPAIEGLGYADQVRITRFTRRLGLSSLRWGRLHLPDRTVVFDELVLADGRRWTPCAVWDDGGGPHQLGPVSIHTDGGAWRVGATELDVALSPHHVLHDGSAFDPIRIPGVLDRATCHLVGGPTEETRWLGHPEQTPDGPPSLYEWVRFGALARQTRVTA